MISDEPHRRMDAARVRAELTVQDLWLRYVALGGTCDAFDVDGYLQGLMSLETFQGDVLAQALNEALEDSYRAYRVPLSALPPGTTGEGGLGQLIEDLLDGRWAAARKEAEPPGTAPA